MGMNDVKISEGIGIKQQLTSANTLKSSKMAGFENCLTKNEMHLNRLILNRGKVLYKISMSY
jgi:hypothetical protein